jgi:transposase-like protein
VRQYRAEGAAAFGEKALPARKYPKEVKEAAANEFLTGGKTQSEICIKYGIHSMSSLSRWIECYNGYSSELPQRTEGSAMTEEHAPKRKKPRLGKEKPESEMTETERLRAALKRKEFENYNLQMENDILKKLAEVERRRESQPASGWKKNI